MHCCICPIEQSNCLEGFMPNGTIQNLFPEIGKLHQPMHELRLFPEMKFNTVGFISTWSIGGTINNGEANTEIQIWRNSSSNASYIKVAAFQLNEGSSVAISQNVWEYQVNPPTPVIGGDIVGILQPSNSSANVFFQENNGPKNVIIPVAEGSESPEIITSMNLLSNSNDYPLIAVNITTETSTTNLSKTAYETSPEKTISVTTVMTQATSAVAAKMNSAIHVVIGNEITSSLQFHEVSNIIDTSSLTTDAQVRSIQKVTSSSSVSGTPTLTTQQPLSSITSEAFLLAVSIIGSSVIVVTVPLIVIILAIFIHKKIKSKGKGIENIESHPPVSEEPLAQSHLEGFSVVERRESMQDNPLYYYPVVPKTTLVGYTMNTKEHAEEVLYEEITPIAT